jgi:type I restriction enzyme S subunit
MTRLAGSTGRVGEIERHDLNQQVEIAALLAAVDQKVGLHLSKLARLKELFGRLLQDLMTGEVITDELVGPDRTSEESAA